MSIRQKDATCTSRTLINSSKNVLNERTNFDLLFKLIKDNNSFDTIKSFLNGWDNEGATPLAYAVRARAPLSTVKALVRAGVDPLTADINGVTPVLWAAANGDEDTIAYFREHGAAPDEKQKAAVKRLLRKVKEGIHFQ